MILLAKYLLLYPMIALAGVYFMLLALFAAGLPVPEWLIP